MFAWSFMVVLLSIHNGRANQIFHNLCEEKIDKLTQITQQLQAENKQLLEQNQQLFSNIRDLTEEMNHVNSRQETQATEYSLYIEQMKQMQQQFQQLQNVTDADSSYVAFTVATAAGENVPITAGDRVPYTEVVRNYGGFFSTANSSFVCPYSGYYLLMVSILQQLGENVGVDIYLDGEFLVRSFSHDERDQSTASSQVVTLCTQGQVVWVQSYGDSLTADRARTSTFSGILLRIV